MDKSGYTAIVGVIPIASLVSDAGRGLQFSTELVMMH